MSVNRTVAEYMGSPAVTLSPDQEILDAMRTLLQHDISGAPVVDGKKKLVGILSNKDCIRVAYNASYHQEWGGPVKDYMSPKVETIDAAIDIVAAADKFLNSTYRRFPVLSNKELVGVISRHDILGALVDMWSNIESTATRPHPQ